MKNHLRAFAAVGLLALAASTARAQERIVNGNMATFTGGVADGWAQSDDASLPRITPSQSALNSPFTNRYANNNSSWLLDDDGTKSVDGYTQNGYAPAAAINLNFDFRQVGTPVAGGTWGVQFNNTPQPGANVSLVQFRIDTNFYAAPFDGSLQPTPGNVAGAPILALSGDTWYNVNGTIDVPAGTFSGDITPEGGSPTHFSGLINTTGLTSLVISGTQIRDRTAPDNATLLIDNVSVTPVPEPAALGLLTLAAPALLARCRRRA